MNSSVESLKPLDRPVALGDQVYAALRERLRDGRIRSEQRLQGESLAATLGVSRTTVRGAGAWRARDSSSPTGAASSSPHIRIATSTRSISRATAGPEAMRLVAELGPDAAARRRSRRSMQWCSRTAPRREGVLRANARFRTAWLALVPNRRLMRLIELYADHVWYLRVLTLSDAGVRDVVAQGPEACSRPSRSPTATRRRRRCAALAAAKRLRQAVGLNSSAGAKLA